jgi:hypothetical protein
MSTEQEEPEKGPALTEASVRLFVILARSARRAVVFRRGPSKRVLLLEWNTETDVVTPGQWLIGRIYDRRCDLSPSGDKLVYFVGKYRGPFATYTVVSRPPWLTALALWPHGDAWGGGGLFKTETLLRLNHRATKMKLALDYRLPSRFKVEPLGEHSGLGEDFPIYHLRLQRDGWRCTNEGTAQRHPPDLPLSIAYDPPITYCKARPESRAGGFELRMRITGFHEQEGPKYVTEYDILDPAREREATLGRLDWADWDVNGELLFAREGRLYRLEPRRRDGAVDVSEAREVADLRGYTFQRRSPPLGATRW